MGFSYSTYVGPYARCEVGTKKKQATKQTCPNVACPNMGARLEGFCPLCGSAVAEVPYTYIVDAVDTGDLQEAINERLADVNGDAYRTWSRENGSHLWKPNVGDIGRHLDSREAFSLAEITPADIHNEIAAFLQFFAAEMRALHAAYGEGKVAVQWGVIQDYS